MAQDFSGGDGRLGGASEYGLPTASTSHEPLRGLKTPISIEEELPAVKSPSDGNNLRFRRNPFQIKSSDWDLGWTDGRYGQPSSTRLDILNSEASLQIAAALAEGERERAANEAKSHSLDLYIGYLNGRSTKLHDLYTKIWEKRANNRQEYSQPLAFLYLVFTLGLFIADIPLTVKLVASGFGLGPSEDFTASQTATVDMFENRKALLQFAIDYWAIGMLALGLLLLGVFIKLFLDKVILCEPEERIGNESTHKHTKIFFYVVLALYLATFILLGTYREEQLTIKRKLDVIAQVDNELASRMRMLREKPDSEVKKTLVDARLQELNDSKSNKAAPVFILLTLLFPIVGGICFSLGTRRLYNARLYKEVKKEFASTREELQRAIGVKKQLDDTLKIQREELEQMKENDELKRMIDIRRNIYLHGYERGSRMRQTLNEGESLYERCESLVLTKLAEKSRASLWEQKNGHK